IASKTPRVPLTSFAEASGASPPRSWKSTLFKVNIRRGAFWVPWPRLMPPHPRISARVARNRLYYTSVRAPTYRYHGIMGGRTPSVSPADEEIRADVGGREEADPLRGQQQLPPRRSVPALRSQGEGLADVGCGRNGVHRLLHGVRGARRGPQPPA